MNSKRPDITEVLEEEKSWYVEQIKRIDLALSVLRGEKLPNTDQSKEKPKTVPWTAEIDKLFSEYDRLTMTDLRNKLAEKGFPEALERGYYSTIFQTLKRKIDNGELEKQDDMYCKKRQRTRLHRRIDVAPNDVSGDNGLPQQ